MDSNAPAGSSMIVLISNEDGKPVPARDFAETLPEVMRVKFLKFVTLMEEGKLQQGPLVDGSGPGRFIVRIPDEENRLKEFWIFSDHEPELKADPGTREQLLFYPIDVDSWKCSPIELWLGRPGEQVFNYPDDLMKVLTNIEKTGKSEFAVQRPDGVFEILIPGRNIRGTAVWKPKFN